MINLLNLLNEGKISEEKADEIFENVVSDMHKGIMGEIPDELGLDNYEWTAYCHGIEWKTIAEWRLYGWPTICSICKKRLNYKEYHWTSDSTYKGLVHIECLGE